MRPRIEHTHCEKCTRPLNSGIALVYRYKDGTTRYRKLCRDCSREKNKAWHKANPGKAYEYNKTARAKTGDTNSKTAMIAKARGWQKIVAALYGGELKSAKER